MTIYTNTRRVEAWQLPKPVPGGKNWIFCGQLKLGWVTSLKKWVGPGVQKAPPGVWLCRDIDIGNYWIVSNNEFKARYREEVRDGWQPIETAPRDGTVFWYRNNVRTIDACRWYTAQQLADLECDPDNPDRYEAGFYRADDDTDEALPTEWMPAQ